MGLLAGLLFNAGYGPLTGITGGILTGIMFYWGWTRILVGWKDYLKLKEEYFGGNPPKRN